MSDTVDIALLRARVTELENAFGNQRDNYIRLYEAVLGEGCETSDMKDVESIARDHREKYHELLYAVARKFPDEDRHQTALRYIREREETALWASEASEAKEAK